MCESRTAGLLGSAEMNEKGMGLTVYITMSLSICATGILTRCTVMVSGQPQTCSARLSVGKGGDFWTVG